MRYATDEVNKEEKTYYSTPIKPILSNPTVVIVGSGFSGIVTAIRILQLARKKLNLVIIHDKMKESFGELAYGHTALSEHHFLNMQSSRASLFREDLTTNPRHKLKVRIFA